MDKTLLEAATIQESLPIEENKEKATENKTLMESDGSDDQNEQRIAEKVEIKEEFKIKDLPSKQKDAEDLEDLFNFDGNDEKEEDKPKLIQKKQPLLNEAQNSYIVSGYLTQMNTTPEKIQKKESDSNNNNQEEKQNFKRLKPLKNQINNNNKKINNNKIEQKKQQQEKMQKPKMSFPCKYAFPSLQKKDKHEESKDQQIVQNEQQKSNEMIVNNSRPKIECTMAVTSPVLSPRKGMYKSEFWNESYKVEPTFAIGSPTHSQHAIEEEEQKVQQSFELKKELTQPLESPGESPQKDKISFQHQKTVSLCSEEEKELEGGQDQKLQKLKNMTTMQFDSSASDNKKEVAQKRSQNEFLTQGTPEQQLQQIKEESKKKSKKNSKSKSSGLSSQISNNSQNKQQKFQQKEEEKFQASLKHTKLAKTQTQQIEDLQVKIALSVFFSTKLKINKNTKDALKLWNVFVINKLSEDFNIFVVTEVIKEYPFLKAINIGAKIVRHKWIQQSIEENKLLDYTQFQLPKEEYLNALKIDVSASLSKTLVFESNIFDNVYFWISPSVSQKTELEYVIRSAGGNILTKSPINSETENVIALLNKRKDQKKIKEFARENITMHEVEFIIVSCLKQELDFSIGNVN